MKLVKKLSAKTICGNVKADVKKLGEGWKQKELFRVVGIANGLKTGDGEHGPWSAGVGTFKAVNSETGEEFRSAVLFLPDVAQDLVIAAVQAAEGDVNIGFVIGIQEDANSVTGYVYTATPLFKPAEDDPIARLESQIAGQLEAPKQAEKAPAKGGKEAKSKA